MLHLCSIQIVDNDQMLGQLRTLHFELGEEEWEYVFCNHSIINYTHPSPLPSVIVFGDGAFEVSRLK